MRYLPLTPTTAPRCSASSARRRSTPCSSTCRAAARLAGPGRPAARIWASWRSSGRWPAWPARTGRPGAGPFFCGAGRLSPPCAGQRRPHHPALGVPDQLHALPAGDRPGHAAVPVRVPDPGRGADRHGGGQRLACTTARPPAAEAVMMAARVTRRSKAVLSGGLHPHYAEAGRDPGPRRRRRDRCACRRRSTPRRR